MKINNKGFTLIEVLAVIVILALLMAIMVPSVNSILEKNKKSSYEDLKKSILQAAKMYMSDHRYDVSVSGSCSEDNTSLVVSQVDGIELNESKLPIRVLLEVGNIKTNKSDDMINPKNDNKVLDDESVVTVKYDCNTRDYIYEILEGNLVWKNKNN